VVSIGNLTVGGTGKTPITAWLAEGMQAAGRRPAVLHGGYAADEPELHRRWHPDVPVFVDRDRVAAARQAERSGASVILLDDGFQHRRLARDVDIVLISAESGIDDVKLLPRGPWRERLSALGRASMVVVTRKVATAARAGAVADGVRGLVESGRVAIVVLEPGVWLHEGVKTEPPARPALAVAGIARPELFAENAMMAGARVNSTLWFADHHEYTVDDARKILETAGGAPVVTTAKDAVKLESLLPGHLYWVLEQRVRPETGSELIEQVIEGALR